MLAGGPVNPVLAPTAATARVCDNSSTRAAGAAQGDYSTRWSTMPWEMVLLVAAAAASGAAFRTVIGFVAERRGHSRREAEEAVGTMGLSLLTRKETPRH